MTKRVAFGSLSEAESHTIHYPSGDATHCFALLFLARSWSGELKLDPQKAVEASFADLDSPPFPLHAPAAHALDRLREFLCSGEFQLR